MNTYSPAVIKLLDGLVDLHCHSGPAPFPREFDHVEAAREGETLGMRAFVAKSHHHSTVMDLKAAHRSFSGIKTQAFGGIVLNNQVGGLNPYAVEMCLRMGGKIVWFPTFSSQCHIAYHEEAVAQGFPESAVELTTIPVSIHDDSGELSPLVTEIVDLIIESEAILNSGHLSPGDMEELFQVGADRGLTRMAVSHPNFISDLTLPKAQELARMGVYMEHEAGMYIPNEEPFFEIQVLLDWIGAIGVERSYIASDLGQVGRTHPVDAFVYLATQLLDHGVPEKDIRMMFVETPTHLLNLEPAR